MSVSEVANVLVFHWWSILVLCGGVVIIGCGWLRWRWNQEDESKESEGVVSYRSTEPYTMSMTPNRKEPLPPLSPDLGETLKELGQKKGIAAWRKKNQAVASRERISTVIDAEIKASKKRIEYIRTIAEESSVIDEENLRIAKIRQEMDRLELQDMVERKRLEKELATLEHDIRDLQRDPELPPQPKTTAERRQEEFQREQEKQDHELNMQKMRARQGLKVRQELTKAMNEEIDKVANDPKLTDAQKEDLIEDIKDYYQDLIARSG